MWKVKRMNTAPNVVLTVGAGDVAAFLASGSNAVVGKTPTLQLKPEHAETPARARQIGTLSPPLRSIADRNVMGNKSDDQALGRGKSITVIDYGMPSPTTIQN
jgi:pilus assembly protein CpaB